VAPFWGALASYLSLVGTEVDPTLACGWKGTVRSRSRAETSGK
jgi:hypothetical protein